MNLELFPESSGMTIAGWTCVAGAGALLFIGLVYLFPDQLRSALDRSAGLFSRRSKGQRLAAQWQKRALRRGLLFARNIFTPDGDIITALPQDRLTLALIEVVSWQSRLQLTVSGAIAGYCLASAFTVVTFFLGYAAPLIMNDLGVFGLLSAMHACAVAGCAGIVVMFGINVRLTLLRGLLDAVKRKIVVALAARS
jgi:hypothetical protein